MRELLLKLKKYNQIYAFFFLLFTIGIVGGIILDYSWNTTIGNALPNVINYTGTIIMCVFGGLLLIITVINFILGLIISFALNNIGNFKGIKIATILFLFFNIIPAIYLLIKIHSLLKERELENRYGKEIIKSEEII